MSGLANYCSTPKAHMATLCVKPFDKRPFEQKMSRTPGEPPCIPQYWTFVGTVLKSTHAASVVRGAILNSFEQMAGKWRKRGEWSYQAICSGLDISCHIFKHEGTTVVELNLLSGDRFAWHATRQRICGLLHASPSKL